MNKISIILVEYHALLRNGLRIILDHEEDFEVVGEAEDLGKCLKMVEKSVPDIVLMDISMPDFNSLEVTRKIKKIYPKIKIIILGVNDTEEYVYQVLSAGASGYLLKKSVQRDMVPGIRTVYGGEPFLSHLISKNAVLEYIAIAQEPHGDIFDRLTKREREVLRLIAEGRSNKEISEFLTISVKTVEGHRAHIMKKLNIHNTANLTRFAMKQGIVRLDV